MRAVNIKWIWIGVVFLVLGNLTGCGSNNEKNVSKPAGKATTAKTETFTNPIVKLRDTPDPWVIYKDGYYYMTFTEGSTVDIWKSKSLVNMDNAKKVTVWSPPLGTMHSKDVWAPELHWINGKWYIYFAADDGTNANHRMYVLQSKTDNAQGKYEFKGKIADPNHDYWAIDGTVLTLKGKNYLVWSGWDRKSNKDIFPQNLYIAPMSNPWTISGNRQLISTPEYNWEEQDAAINEGPEILKKNGRVFLVYSASGSWTPNYKLGMLTLKRGADPMKKTSWKKDSQPVFERNDKASVYGPGHASFTTSPDGKETWIVYHATSSPTDGWNNRTARIQRIHWKNGKPVFGEPVSTDKKLKFPSGS